MRNRFAFDLLRQLPSVPFSLHALNKNRQFTQFARVAAAGIALCAVGMTSVAARISGSRPGATVRAATLLSEPEILRLLESGVNGDTQARSRSVERIQAAVADQDITGDVAYYDVAGDTRSAIRRSIVETRARYTHADYDANTQWHIHYKYSPGRSADRGASTFSVDESITITIPRWVDHGTADSGVSRSWTTYSRNLLFHEEGHYLIDEACVLAMRERVSELPGNTPFSQVDEMCKQTMHEYSQMNADYDRITNHGETQGAAF
jgi:predicted secreted Zn-dependent protease